jgi:hypothetical protein
MKPAGGPQEGALFSVAFPAIPTAFGAISVERLPNYTMVYML